MNKNWIKIILLMNRSKINNTLELKIRNKIKNKMEMKIILIIQHGFIIRNYKVTQNIK